MFPKTNSPDPPKITEEELVLAHWYRTYGAYCTLNHRINIHKDTKDHRADYYPNSIGKYECSDKLPNINEKTRLILT